MNKPIRSLNQKFGLRIFCKFSKWRYGLEKLDADVHRLEVLNQQLKEDCVLEVADNSKLTGEFR